MSPKLGSDFNEYRTLKLKLRSLMPAAEKALPRVRAEFDAAVRAEGIAMSRAERRRLLREIVGEILDESEV